MESTMLTELEAAFKKLGFQTWRNEQGLTVHAVGSAGYLLITGGPSMSFYSQELVMQGQTHHTSLSPNEFSKRQEQYPDSKDSAPTPCGGCAICKGAWQVETKRGVEWQGYGVIPYEPHI